MNVQERRARLASGVHDVIGAVVLLGLFAVARVGIGDRTGSAWVLPRAISWVVGVGGVVVLLMGVGRFLAAGTGASRQPVRVNPIRVRESTLRESTQWSRTMGVVGFATGMGVYIASIDRFGFWMVSAVYLLAVTLLLARPQQWRGVAACVIWSVGGIVGCYLLFSELLGVRMP